MAVVPWRPPRRRSAEILPRLPMMRFRQPKSRSLLSDHRTALMLLVLVGADITRADERGLFAERALVSGQEPIVTEPVAENPAPPAVATLSLPNARDLLAAPSAARPQVELNYATTEPAHTTGRRRSMFLSRQRSAQPDEPSATGLPGDRSATNGPATNGQGFWDTLFQAPEFQVSRQTTERLPTPQPEAATPLPPPPQPPLIPSLGVSPPRQTAPGAAGLGEPAHLGAVSEGGSEAFRTAPDPLLPKPDGAMPGGMQRLLESDEEPDFCLFDEPLPPESLPFDLDAIADDIWDPERSILDERHQQPGLPAAYSSNNRFRNAYGRLGDSFRRIAQSRQRLDSGMGLLWVRHAPMVLDTTEPRNQFRIRGDLGFGMQFPDRSEYYRAAPPLGPDYLGSIDTRSLAFMFEVGGEALSVQTEIPVQGYSAEFGEGHSAVGDIRITQKLRLFNADEYQVTQMLRVHTPTGNRAIGAGTGHVSMEPGALLRYKLNDWTYFHSEFKYLLPIGGNPDFAGDVLTYGFGLSTVWYESLDSAVMPTLELQSINFLTGGKTGLDGDFAVDSEATALLVPGIVWARDSGGDLGAFELGAGLGMAIGRQRHYETLLRIELRLTR